MARRRSRRDDVNIVAVLLNAPWQISAVLAAVTFGLMRWVIPSQLTTPALAGLGKMASGLAPVVSVLILLIAAASYFRNKSSPSSPDYPEDPTFERADPSLAPEIDFTRFSGRPNCEVALPTAWSIELLRKLEWHRFETLCAEYFRTLGKRVETVTHGADGGIDARIYAHDSQILEYAVQCKAWNNPVGVKPVRELFGVMAHESAGKGIFMTTSTFTDDAMKFASEHSDKVFLVDGPRFIKMIELLPAEKKAKLLTFATEGDYTTPTCASCGIKMVWCSKGDFWGCKNYPKCKSTLRVANI
ncbi:Mrr restriction system protein [mine drainage metagenome]|uniref:Mrr restriction system protein n=1 Tax=mine drainage metagenome TaxID=410659 RepID=A0A1J5SXT2_9ZZZZ